MHNQYINKKYQKQLIKEKIDVLEELKFVYDDKAKPIPKYTFSHFIDLEKKLNIAKTELGNNFISNTILHSKFMSAFDLYSGLRYKITNEYNGQHVTNAWLKCYELISHFNLIGDTDPIKIFMNAELPGAFISAINHYMKTIKRDVKFDWYASSLVARTENRMQALGDQYGIYARNTDHWLMDAKNDGDVTNIENLRDFKKKLGEINLYTHDLGIDVSDDYEKQEIGNLHAHLGAALSGFMVLARGGNFIAKQYTFFHPLSVNLIIIYASMFEEFYICKPLTSRPANSEIYLVGKGFIGMSKRIEEILTTKLTNFNLNPVMIKKDIPIGTTDILTKFADTVYQQQIDFIEESNTLYKKYKNNIGEFRFRIKGLRMNREQNWIKIHPIKRINTDDHLRSNTK